jgi:hypothetical protein
MSKQAVQEVALRVALEHAIARKSDEYDQSVFGDTLAIWLAPNWIKPRSVVWKPWPAPPTKCPISPTGSNCAWGAIPDETAGPKRASGATW